MKFLVVLACLIAVAYSYTVSEQINAFKAHIEKYDKKYESTEEMQERFEIFKKNMDISKELTDREEGSAVYGDSPFMDMDPEEFAKGYLMPKSIYKDFVVDPSKDPIFDLSTLPEVELPTSYDWRSKGMVTPVYNQAQCGSCWAFSATETIESYNAIAGNGLHSEAMQQIVSCDTTSYGCNGGWTSSAYNYVESAGGIEPYADFPYTATDGSCSNFNAADINEKIASWAYVTQSEDETAMANYLYSKGPLSVCVDASQWQNYQGGVITSCGQQLDHCVQATGFSVQDGTPAWNVRNSWGTSWGLQGYLYVERGDNMCGIATTVTGVTV